MPGHGIKQSAKNVQDYVKNQVYDTVHRFDAEPELKKAFRKGRRGDSVADRLIDTASFKNTRIANDFIRKNKVTANDVADWRRKTRNNELAKSVALYATPVALTGIGLAAYKKIKGRKDEDKMEKMSAEKYTEFIQKLAEEITDEVVNEDMEVEAAEGIDCDEIAARAIQAYESAQMRKEAAENDYVQACAYEDAAMIILDQDIEQ